MTRCFHNFHVTGETIQKDGSDTLAGDMGSIAKLRNDVLKQAEASLAAFIGAVNYSDKPVPKKFAIPHIRFGFARLEFLSPLANPCISGQSDPLILVFKSKNKMIKLKKNLLNKKEGSKLSAQVILMHELLMHLATE